MAVNKELKKVESYLHKIDSIFRLISTSEAIDPAEIELLKSYLGKAYERSVILEHLIREQEPSIGVRVKNEEEPKPDIPPVKADLPVFSAQEEQVPVPEKLSSNGSSGGVQNGKEEKPVAGPDVPQKDREDIQRPVDSKGGIPSLNDRLKKAEKDVNMLSGISRSYRDMISLNDKISFMHDLFSGNAEAYNKALAALEGMPSVEDAKRFLEENYSGEFHWEKKEASRDRFFRLVELRHMDF